MNIPATTSWSRLLVSGPRGWKFWWHRLVSQINHAEILQQVALDGANTFNYMFMVAVAAGIATIGLLLNSPAVIIGAMLISPLMGPIVATGFALTTVDIELGKSSAGALLKGALAAIAFTAMTVWLSPVQELTPEILARTRPNLFDLLVAALSGAAGGYAMIRGRGGAIVGVAIATALMPPLAVVGYGLATRHWQVAAGALMLFVTNMVTISVTVALVAEWYGFGRRGFRKGVARQVLLALVVLTPLGVPLFYSLKRIAWESFATATIRGTLEKGAATLPDGTLSELRAEFPEHGRPVVNAILVTTQPSITIRQEMTQALEKALDGPVLLRLSQLHAADANSAQQPLPIVMAGGLTGNWVDERLLATRIRAALPVALHTLAVDVEKHTVVVVPEAHPDFGLSAYRHMAESIAGQHPDWSIELLPPVQRLPRILFANRSAAITPDGQRTIDMIAWALGAWKITRVNIFGYASSDGNGSGLLARQRAENVGAALSRAGLDVQAHGRYPYPDQKALEQAEGLRRFRAAEVFPDRVLPHRDGSK